MSFVEWRNFAGKQAWDAIDVATIEGASVRVHWTDQPYVWHVNDGDEVFVVLNGQIDMKVRENHDVEVTTMKAGDIFHATARTEHVAHPIGVAHILVVEKKGSL